jgi:hypothetical protein
MKFTPVDHAPTSNLEVVPIEKRKTKPLVSDPENQIKQCPVGAHSKGMLRSLH